MVENNTAPSIRIYLRRQGKIVDLSGATAQLIIKARSDDSITNTGHQGCVIEDDEKGIIRYDQESGDFSEPGFYYCDVLVTYAGGTSEVFEEQLTVEVRARNTDV